MSDVVSTCSLEMFHSVRAAVQLEQDAVESISSYLLGQINDDGGFRGRTKTSDLYYTVFGMTSLSALGVEFPFEKTWKYLKGFGDGTGLDFVHLSCLVRCRAIYRFLKQDNDLPDSEKSIFSKIESFRTDCGGYSHITKGAGKGSVYASFLACCAYQDCGMDVRGKNNIIRSVEGLKCRRGGYGNEENMESGTTTATAAALVLLKHMGMNVDVAAVEWLAKLCTERGGFLAGENAQMPDLLSTGTALHALRTVGSPLVSKSDECREFIDLLWMQDGGFAGSPLELITDCEYTFYGLLGLGSLVYENTH